LSGHGTAYENAAEVVQATPDECKASPKLWEALETYLACVGEATISDFRGFLIYVDSNLRPSLQAVDSAVKTHSDLFDEVHNGREKLIRLKTSNS
jgi:hypothetical protein